VKIEDSHQPNRLKVSICDNGVGIEPERLENFFKLDENITTLGTDSEKGTGLGLILCKEFIERHGDTITIDSVPGKGSCFSFTLEQAK